MINTVKITEENTFFGPMVIIFENKISSFFRYHAIQIKTYNSKCIVNVFYNIIDEFRGCDCSCMGLSSCVECMTG